MKRILISSALSKLGLATTLLRLRFRGASEWLTVLTYHRAGPPPSIDLIDEKVVAATRESFDRQMAFCKKYLSVIGIEDLLAFTKGAALPRCPVLITFDDGYLDNFSVAYPLLKKHGLKAVFFIATSYIENRTLFWWDRIHYLIKASRKEAIQITYPHRVTIRLAPGRKDRGGAIKTMLGLVKDEYDLELPRFLEHLEKAAGVDLDGSTESALVRDHLMTWDHVRELRQGGMDVQSHTHTHRVLQTMPERDLADDLKRSRRKLEEVLNEPVRALAYPVGKAPEYSERIRDLVSDAGYDLGFSNRSGINRFTRFDALDTLRITVDPTFTDDYFASVIALPSLAYPAPVR